MNNGSAPLRLLVALLLTISTSLYASAASVSPRRSAKTKPASITENARTQKRMNSLHRGHVVRTNVRTATSTRRVHRYYERFSTSSFAVDQTLGDVTEGEDPVVRQAAISALGNMNGTIVIIDPSNGRILAMVNQKLALSAGATPCSTIKIPVALAALSENLVTKDTKVLISKTWSMSMTPALAHSNNAYFEAVGRKLGFERYSYYAHQFGLGELAGWNIAGEHVGVFPQEPLEAKLGGIGRMCSFGESISMTPLQLGAIVAAIANGGTLYYMQHLTTAEEVTDFQPKIKRHLEIAPVLPEIEEGMAGAVRYGTARSLRWSFKEEEVLGKTGTCSNHGTRYGWFASFANTDYGRIVTVVFLQGGRPTFGPKAAEIAGHVYRNLYDQSFFNSGAKLRPASATNAQPLMGAGEQ